MNARSSMQGDGRINTSKDDSYLDSYISTIGVEFLQMEKGGGCGMSGRGREREVYISESSSSPQFQQQRPPLFPKALPIFHQNHILNSSNFEHEMPGEVGNKAAAPFGINGGTLSAIGYAGACTSTNHQQCRHSIGC
ncbi:uncharacterized protein [Malus domestica]|uniref:uncharacterized protein isoform X3 n=1 Tax=Malus domestica TaxID=3750 RepID=UPI0010AAB1A7|nr:uncharacterized protein LOC103427865 isoform X7 [Malus domestica]